MQNKFNKITWAVAIAAAAFASQANAGGYQINEQSVSGQGYGHAGRSSNVNDASIVFGNPAGMSFLDRAQVTVGGTYLHVNTDIKNAEASIAGGAMGPMEGTTDGDIVSGTLVPFAFYAHPVNERLAFGFGVYAPFGSKTEYEDSFLGGYFGNHTEVTVMTAQPTVSYRFNDQWSVGLGVTYNRVDGELAARTPNLGAGPVPDLTNVANPSQGGEVRVEGDDEAWGYNIGVMYQPVPETTFGLTYRSKVSYTLDGTVRARNVNTSDPQTGAVGVLNDTGSGSLDLTTPETVNFSVTQQMTDRLRLMAGASWVRWSRFDRIRVENDLGIAIDEPQDYSNAWAFAVGGEYQLTPQLALRAGVTLDETPTSDTYRSARIPSDDRRIFSIGAGWTPVENLTLDFAYSYLTERSTTVSPPDRYVQQGLNASYSADYKNEAHGFGAQLTYRF